MKNIQNVKLGIIVNDGLYHKTWMGVLGTLFQAFKSKNEVDFMLFQDREKLQYAIKSMLFSHYLLFQQKRTLLMEMETDFDCYRELKAGENLESMTIQILLDDEVQKFKNAHPYGYDGKFFVLDTNLDYPNNSPIYNF